MDDEKSLTDRREDKCILAKINEMNNVIKNILIRETRLTEYVFLKARFWKTTRRTGGT